MNEMEILEAIRCFGRCEVIYLKESGYLAKPIAEGAILVTPEAHQENQIFFQNHDD